MMSEYKDKYKECATITETSECLKTALKVYLDYGFIPVLWDVNDGFYSRTEYKIKSEDDAEAISELYHYLRNQ
jgi:endoglucanase